jgi:hypothetical protein
MWQSSLCTSRDESQLIIIKITMKWLVSVSRAAGLGLTLSMGGAHVANVAALRMGAHQILHHNPPGSSIPRRLFMAGVTPPRATRISIRQLATAVDGSKSAGPTAHRAGSRLADRLRRRREEKAPGQGPAGAPSKMVSPSNEADDDDIDFEDPKFMKEMAQVEEMIKRLERGESIDDIEFGEEEVEEDDSEQRRSGSGKLTGRQQRKHNRISKKDKSIEEPPTKNVDGEKASFSELGS